AEYELYIEGDNDSVIDIATRYYDRHGASHKRLMLAHYLQGFIRNNANNHNAVVSLLKAEKYAKKLGDHRVLGLIYWTLSSVYSNIYNFSDELDYAERAIAEFEIYGDSIYLDYVLEALCNSYSNVKNFAKSESIANVMLERINFENNTFLAANLNIEKGIACLERECYDTAAIAFGSVYENAPERFTALDVKRLLTALYYSGEVSKATTLWPILKERYPGACAPPGMFLEQNDYEKAYEALNENYHDLQHVVYQLKSQRVHEAGMNFVEEERAAAERSAARSKSITFLVIAGALLGGIAVGVYVVMRKRIAWRRETELMGEISLLASELVNLQLAKSDAAHDELFAFYGQGLEHLCEAYFEESSEKNSAREEANRQKEIHVNAAARLEKLRKELFTGTALSQVIETGYPGLAQQLAADLPALTEKDRIMFMGFVLGLSARAIAVMCGDKLSAVYMRRSRLRKKIEQLPTDKAAAYLRFFE
ncbi:MAG: hypothetical protein K2L28_10250, partial [Muribaculaceae bacterium]|nr:hypothetical protein [Muribaculaceae bacterium]